MLFIVLFILSRSTASGQTFHDIEDNTDIRNETTTEVLVGNDFERIGTFHENMFYNYTAKHICHWKFQFLFAPNKTLSIKRVGVYR